MLGIRSRHSLSSLICSPHERGARYLLLSRPYSRFATKPALTMSTQATDPQGRILL
jgi:hypothetical protein